MCVGGKIIQEPGKRGIRARLNASPNVRGGEAGPAPSIEDVAKRAGVSIATVSYVLNGRGRVSTATRERVSQIIREIGYVPSARGRSLALGQAQTVGLVASEFMTTSDGFMSLLGSLASALAEKGYHLLLLSGAGDDALRSLRAVASSGRVDGAIIMALDGEGEVGDLSTRIPIVAIGSGGGCPSVEIDHSVAAEIAVGHLLDLGHQRLGLITFPSQAAPVWRAAAERLVAASVGTLASVEGERGYRGGFECAMTLLAGAGRPTGLAVMDDAMAEGALAAAANLGIGVPEQLSIVGFGDTHHGSQALPPVTTIAPHWGALGAAAGEMMLAALAGETPERQVVRPALVVRGSTAPAGSFATPETAIEEPVIKSGPAFAIWSERLEIEPASGRHGVYVGDTRMLSLYRARLDGKPLLPLAVTSETPESVVARYLSKTAAATLSIVRQIRIIPGGMEDSWEWRWWGPPSEVVLDLAIAADFQDIFAIRGMPPAGQGAFSIENGEASMTMRYGGRDGIERRVTIVADREPEQSAEFGWSWRLPAEPGRLAVTASWINPVLPSEVSPQPSWAEVELANPEWSAVLSRSRADLQMLGTLYAEGPVPMAGLPWFGTLFGRDAIVTALETLAVAPDLGVGVARALARLQGSEVRPQTEEAPGKIIHELRLGEMARVGAVPFARYYGSVDATPLFVTLVAALWKRTADRELLAELLPAVERAVAWLRSQRNSFGLFDFLPSHGEGLLVQSWKDSSDSMVFADGSHGVPPLAVAEVQGYAFQAFSALSGLLDSIGRGAEAKEAAAEAAAVRSAFHDAFWMPSRGYYALAVDGRGRQLDALSSDPGQCLWTGVIPEEFRGATVRTLLSPSLFSGWGVRTLASEELAYDPYSYHRGSVWPHDSALICAGLRAVGALEGATRLAGGLLDAGSRFPSRRLPELFSGEERAAGGPFRYPGACAPQAWAAGAAWLTATTLIGLEVDAVGRRIRLSPLPGAGPVRISRLPVGGSLVSIECSEGEATHSGLPEDWGFELAPP